MLHFLRTEREKTEKRDKELVISFNAVLHFVFLDNDQLDTHLLYFTTRLL